MVEHDDAFAELVANVLKQDQYFDFKVATLPNVSTAKTFLRGDKVDLIIIDLVLPNGAGVDVVRSLRLIAKETPMFVLTSLEGVDVEVESLSAMADGFLSKRDFEPGMFRSLCRQMMVRHRRVAPVLKPTIAMQTELTGILEECKRNPNVAPFGESVANSTLETIQAK
jgi:DNA-binding response OmpR family regulator